MVLGSGSIAQALIKSKLFNSYNDIIIYARGVSKFDENSLQEFEREKNEIINLSKKYHSKKFIYFSTQSVYSKKINKYISHKTQLEKYIESNFSNYLILRLPNLIGSHKHTLFQRLVTLIKNNKIIYIDKSLKKEFLHINEIPFILNLLIEFNNQIIDVGFNRSIYILDIVDLLSEILKVDPSVEDINFSYNYECDYTEFLNLIRDKYYYDFNIKSIMENELLSSTD